MANIIINVFTVAALEFMCIFALVDTCRFKKMYWNSLTDREKTETKFIIVLCVFAIVFAPLIGVGLP